MSLEESCDCDGTCSGVDGTGCRLITHKEVEAIVDEVLAPTFRERYSMVIRGLKDRHPRLYGVLRLFGLSNYSTLLS